MKMIIYIYTLLILVALKPDRVELFSGKLNIIFSFIYFFLIAFFLIYHRKLDKNWMRFDVLFLIGYTIVHIQIPLLAAFGIEPAKPSFVWINKDVVNFATWMSVVSINLWMIGYSFFLTNNKLKRSNKYSLVKKDFKAIDYVILLMFLGLIFSAGTVILSGVYNLSKWGGAGVYFLMALSSLIYLRIIYFFRSLPKGISIKNIYKTFIKNKIFISVLTIYFILFLFTGSRGEILRVVLISALSYSIFIRNISFKSIFIAVLVGSFIFTLMGLGRVRESSSNLQGNLFERGYTTFTQTDKRGNVTEELASSVRIQYRALDTIPKYYPYLYGKTYVGGLFGVIPFGSSFVVNTFNIETKYLDSAYYYTYLGQGDNPSYGEGSEILADLYLNFGLIGTFLLMLLFGLYSGKCYLGMRRSQIIYVLLYSILLISALSINRGTIFYIYKSSFYILLFHFVFGMRKK